MSVRTIYRCDKCGKEQENSDQFWKIGVVAFPYGGTLSSYTPFVTKEHQQHVCRPCLESYGIHVQTRDKKPDQPAPPTLEDLIIEIVNKTIDNR